MRDVIIGTVSTPEAVLPLATNVVFLGVVVWLGPKPLNSEKVVLRSA